MCRLLGVVAAERVDFNVLLADRPRSLAALGEEHRDGWGLAACAAGRWEIHKGTLPAARDPRFKELAAKLRGEVLVSHVRKRTVGETRAENSHPFSAGRWVFAHNGTISDRDYVSARVSRTRHEQIKGDTDSELFFAFVMTRLDDAGASGRAAGPDTDKVIAAIARDCRGRARFGSLNFILSDGERSYVHRFGRSLFLLDRGSPGAAGDRRAAAVYVASEAMTDEGWREVADGTLLRIDRRPAPAVTTL